MTTISRVRTVWSGVAGTPWYSNFYFANASGTDQATALIARVGAFWAGLADQIANAVTWNTESEVPLIEATDGKIQAIHSGTAVQGTGQVNTEVMPATVQALLRLSTNGFVNGRRVRGRLFIPAMTEGNNVTGRPGSILLTDILSNANTLRGGTPPWIVWARPHKDPSNPALDRSGSPHNVTANSAWAEWAVLRSRRD